MSTTKPTDATLEGSLKPLLIGLKLAGLNLSPANQSVMDKFWFFYSLAALATSFGGCVYLAVEWNEDFKFSINSTVSSPEFLVSYVQAYVNEVLMISAHSVLVFTAPKQLNKFWKNVQEIQKNLEIDQKYFTKYRIYASIWIVVLTCYDISHLVWVICSLDGLVWKIFVIITYISSFAIVGRSCVLFAICGLAIADIYEKISEKILQDVQKPNSNIDRWIRCHGNAGRASCALTDTFKFTVFISTIYTFFRVVSKAFRIATKISKPVLLGVGFNVYLVWSLADVFLILLRFWFVCYMADSVRTKAKYAANIICNSDDTAENWSFRNDRSCQSIMNLLKLENNVPTFDIMGLFSLGQHLITTLAGTTLTYFVILWQFRNA